MRKLILTLAMLALATAAVYAAPDRTGKIDVGVNVSGAISTDNDIQSTAYVGGNIAYGINKWVAIGFEGGRQKHGSDNVSDGGTTIFGPDFAAIPLFGDIIVRMPIENQQVTPYGIIGLGTVLWDVDSASFNSAGVGGTVETKVGSSIAVKVGGGFDWFINDNWVVNFESAYVFDRPDVTATASINGISASAIDQVKLDYWTIGGGVKYLFD
jgi:opacity protein-like surface antigen